MVKKEVKSVVIKEEVNDLQTKRDHGNRLSHVIHISDNLHFGTEEGTLNTTETAGCISFENLLVLQTLVFFPFLQITFIIF